MKKVKLSQFEQEKLERQQELDEGKRKLALIKEQSNAKYLEAIKPISQQPIENRVVIMPDQKDEITKAGIYIPDNAQEKPQKGIVVAVGPGNPGLPLMVKVGDHVLYGKYGGIEAELNGSTYLIMRESDIYLIL